MKRHFIYYWFLLGRTCDMNADVFFLLDVSGSVGGEHFETVKNFTKDFVRRVKIGPNDTQVGVITFSDYATLHFYLNEYQEKKELLEAIDDLPYEKGSTNTAEAICMLIQDGFNEMNGARPPSGTVFRVVVVVTDGISNRNSTIAKCKNWNTMQAAQALHKANQSVLVYVVGVTDNVDDNELKAIASSEDHVEHLDNFNIELFQETKEERTYEMCEKGMHNYNFTLLHVVQRPQV